MPTGRSIGLVMSHSHRVLAVALVVVLGLTGVAYVLDGNEPTRTSALVPVTESSTEVTTDIVDGDITTTSASVAAAIESSTTAAPTTVPAGATDADCPASAHGAIVDRANQRGALCENGVISYRFPITSAVSQPDPGSYDVYAKDMNTSSNFGGHYSEMTHFVAFTRGKYKGARIAFHSVPTLNDGSYVQTLDSVGTPEMFGESAGCIRVKPDDAVLIWDWLAEGDTVHVIS